jgi:hypothetical protein
MREDILWALRESTKKYLPKKLNKSKLDQERLGKKYIIIYYILKYIIQIFKKKSNVSVKKCCTFVIFNPHPANVENRVSS